MASYKVISLSCASGNKIYRSNDTIKDGDISEHEITRLLKGKYIVESKDEAKPKKVKEKESKDDDENPTPEDLLKNKK